MYYAVHIHGTDLADSTEDDWLSDAQRTGEFFLAAKSTPGSKFQSVFKKGKFSKFAKELLETQCSQPGYIHSTIYLQQLKAYT